MSAGLSLRRRLFCLGPISVGFVVDVVTVEGYIRILPYYSEIVIPPVLHYLSSIHALKLRSLRCYLSIILASDQIDSQICASSWSLAKIILRCTVSKTSKLGVMLNVIKHREYLEI
jgi:hypothetical protein